MEKQLPKVEDLYKETRKALDVYEKMEQDMKKTLPRRERLAIVEKAIETTRDREELKHLEAEKKDLEVSLRVDRSMDPFTLPSQEKEKLQSNYQVEHEEARKPLMEKYDRLSKISKDFAEEASLLLEEIAERENIGFDAARIDLLLNDELYKFPSELDGFMRAGEILKKRGFNRKAKYISDLSFMVDEMKHMLSDLRHADIKRNPYKQSVIEEFRKHKDWR